MLLFPYGYMITSKEIVEKVNDNLPSFMVINEIHLMIFLAVIIGFAFSLIFIPTNTLIQEETTDRQRGKIYGSMNALVGIVSLIPVLGAGALADLIGVSRVITLIGISIILIALLRIFKFK